MQHNSDSVFFEISSDVPGGLLRYKIMGFWDPNTQKRFEGKLLNEMKRFQRIGIQFDCIADLTETMPMGHGVQHEFQTVFNAAQKMGLRKTAAIVANTILKLQLLRLSGSDSYQCFTSEQDALNWLKK